MRLVENFVTFYFSGGFTNREDLHLLPHQHHIIRSCFLSSSPSHIKTSSPKVCVFGSFCSLKPQHWSESVCCLWETSVTIIHSDVLVRSFSSGRFLHRSTYVSNSFIQYLNTKPSLKSRRAAARPNVLFGDGFKAHRSAAGSNQWWISIKGASRPVKSVALQPPQSVQVQNSRFRTAEATDAAAAKDDWYLTHINWSLWIIMTKVARLEQIIRWRWTICLWPAQ